MSAKIYGTYQTYFVNSRNFVIFRDGGRNFLFISLTHLANSAIFTAVKFDNSQMKYCVIFAQNIDCGNTFAQNTECVFILEPPRWIPIALCLRKIKKK